MAQRRVQQIIKQYKETGLEPILGEKVGRPFKPYDEQESEIVQEAHVRYRFDVGDEVKIVPEYLPLPVYGARSGGR